MSKSTWNHVDNDDDKDFNSTTDDDLEDNFNAQTNIDENNQESDDDKTMKGNRETDQDNTEVGSDYNNSTTSLEFVGAFMHNDLDHVEEDKDKEIKEETANQGRQQVE